LELKNIYEKIYYSSFSLLFIPSFSFSQNRKIVKPSPVLSPVKAPAAYQILPGNKMFLNLRKNPALK